MLKSVPVRLMKPRRMNLVLAWLIGLLVSTSVAALGIGWGKSVDCKPGQVDGRCGLGTFLGLLYGGGAGLAILLSMTVYILIIAYRRRRTT
jgi:hypothetical protein